MLELMARDGMRVGEVLNLTPGDIQERSLTTQNPKSGRAEETVQIAPPPRARPAPRPLGGNSRGVQFRLLSQF
jgi:integrase